VLFNSYTFLFGFLPLVLVGWWGLGALEMRRTRLAFLTTMSWAFYAWFQFPVGLYLLPLLWASTGIDWVAGGMIAGSTNPQYRKRMLVIALTFNLTLLGVFKYLGFFAGTVDAFVGLFTEPGMLPVTHLVLPIGISFYTFNSMSYTIDIYRRRVEPARSLLDYATFVALFPHLIAGPIVRYSDIDEQLRNLHRRLTSRMAAVGLFFLTCGLFKKLVIADTLAHDVNRLFAHADHLTMVSGWAAALGFTMQLYFDFSGYSDMAVGLALLLGFRFPQNFDSPYKAVNISDFWRRWHISLSSWLRDYLYIDALGGNRGGRRTTLRNLFITMVLGGLWHGAAWVFVLWGVGHGAMLVVHAVCRERGWVPPWTWVSRAITFACVVVLWVPFRAGAVSQLPGSGGVASAAQGSMQVTAKVLAGMFGRNGLGLGNLTFTGDAAATGVMVPMTFAAAIALLIAFVNVAPNTWQVRFTPSRRHAIVLAGMATWSVLLLAAPSPFLYFQF
jgi:alginate O-acetyltransferase complex protein AlgI